MRPPPLINDFIKRKIKYKALFGLVSHLLLLFLLGHLQCWWVGEGGGLAVGAILHLGHLDRETEGGSSLPKQY